MPHYNYICDSHGEFMEWRPMRDSAKPTPCPTCGDQAPRAISLPSLAMMNGTTRKAHHVNERSADQPRVEKRTSAGDHGYSHGHAGHSHAHKPGHQHGPSRPWMIGH